MSHDTPDEMAHIHTDMITRDAASRYHEAGGIIRRWPIWSFLQGEEGGDSGEPSRFEPSAAVEIEVDGLEKKLDERMLRRNSWGHGESQASA
jgi:hypothetical protein